MALILSLRDWLGGSIADAELVDAALEDAAECASVRRLALYIAVSYVANALSKCEIRTYENNKPVKGELYYALNISPNPNQNGAAFIKQLIENLYYDGDALMVQPSRGKARFQVATAFGREEHTLKEDIFTSIACGTDTINRKIKASDCCYLRLSERHEVRALVDVLMRDLAKVYEASMRSYEKAVGEKFTLENEARASGSRGDEKKDVEEFNDRLKSFLRSPNAVLPLYRNQTLTRLQTNGNAAKSGDVVALRKDIFEATAAAFHIPSTMMYGNTNTTKDVINAFLTFGVDPIATMLSDEFTRKLCGLEGWKRGDRVVVDTARIEHRDIIQHANEIEKLIGSGAYTIDEAREQFGSDPINTDYSRAHWVTKNFAPIEEALQMQFDFAEGGETNE